MAPQDEDPRIKHFARTAAKETYARVQTRNLKRAVMYEGDVSARSIYDWLEEGGYSCAPYWNRKQCACVADVEMIMVGNVCL